VEIFQDWHNNSPFFYRDLYIWKISSLSADLRTEPCLGDMKHISSRLKIYHIKNVLYEINKTYLVLRFVERRVYKILSTAYFKLDTNQAFIGPVGTKVEFIV